MGKSSQRKKARRENSGDNGQKTNHPESPKKPFWKRGSIWLLGVVTTAVVVVLVEDLFEPNIRVVDAKFNSYPVHSGADATLGEVEVRGRNYGLRSGWIDRCELLPNGVYPVPKIAVALIDRSKIRPFREASRKIQFRIPLIPGNAPVFTWRMECFDNRGKWVTATLGTMIAAQDGRTSKPPPLDILNNPIE